MSYTPLGEFVLVKVDDTNEQQTASGLIVTRTTNDAVTYGDVVAVGDGALSEHTGSRLPMDIEIGDRVLFPTYLGTEVTIDSARHKLLRQSELLAKEE